MLLNSALDDYNVKTGYYFGFGSYANKKHQMMALGEALGKNERQPLTPGKVHHLVVDKRGDSLRMLVDDQEVLSARGVKSYGGGSLVFYIWATAKIDNLKVYHLPPSAK